jgi:hypothetical protein
MFQEGELYLQTKKTDYETSPMSPNIKKNQRIGTPLYTQKSEGTKTLKPGDLDLSVVNN